MATGRGRFSGRFAGRNRAKTAKSAESGHGIATGDRAFRVNN